MSYSECPEQDFEGKAIFRAISAENLEELLELLVRGKMGAWYAKLSPADEVSESTRKWQNWTLIV